MGKLYLFLKLFKESYLFALQAIIVNKVRTLLTLLGITIGIFSIISVLTVFDSMENAIESEIATLGNNIVFVQKWPWSMSNDYPWWKYYQRPEPTIADMKEIEKRSNTADGVNYFVELNRDIKYRNNSIEDISVLAVSHSFNTVMPFDLQEGRYFTSSESISGDNVVIIGSKIAENLFGKNKEPLGRKITVFGQKFEVIGVLKEEGEDIFGGSSDNQVLITINKARNLVDLRNVSATIAVRAKPMVSNAEMIDELTGIMRSVRKLKPKADDDFAINETDIITRGFNDFFGQVAIIGWIVGGFSLLVGGFGIANIMFVSVKERTSQIGIQKSLGAKNYFILLQFLFESVFLSLFGGIFGLLIIYLITLLLSDVIGFDLVLTQSNVLVGVLVSAVIGLISGIAPAYSASRLDPVEAMRSTF